jgi:hypothetical protein
MTIINIGVSTGENIKGVSFDKPFKEITYQEVIKAAKSVRPEIKGIDIQGWADVTYKKKGNEPT